MEVQYVRCCAAAMPGRGLATLVRAEVVMTGGDTVTVTQQHPARGRTARPGHAWPSPGQEHRGRGDGGEQQKHLNRYDSGL